MITRKQIEKAIKEATGDSIEVCQGNGYVYFWGQGLEAWSTTSVPVCRINHLSLNRWVDVYKEMKQDEMKGRDPFVGRSYTTFFLGEEPVKVVERLGLLPQGGDYIYKCKQGDNEFTLIGEQLEGKSFNA